MDDRASTERSRRSVARRRGTSSWPSLRLPAHSSTSHALPTALPPPPRHHPFSSIIPPSSFLAPHSSFLPLLAPGQAQVHSLRARLTCQKSSSDL
eukprot:7665451-Pyramimonas_sp.AAC.1